MRLKLLILNIIEKTFLIRSTTTKRSGLREAERENVETTKVQRYKKNAVIPYLKNHADQWEKCDHFRHHPRPLQDYHSEKHSYFLLICVCSTEYQKLKVATEIWTRVLLLFSLFFTRYFLIMYKVILVKVLKKKVFVYLKKLCHIATGITFLKIWSMMSISIHHCPLFFFFGSLSSSESRVEGKRVSHAVQIVKPFKGNF